MRKKKNIIRQLSYADAINEAISISMKRDKKLLLIGLGVDDPKGIFGTTKGLKQKFSSSLYTSHVSQ